MMKDTADLLIVRSNFLLKCEENDIHPVANLIRQVSRKGCNILYSILDAERSDGRTAFIILSENGHADILACLLLLLLDANIDDNWLQTNLKLYDLQGLTAVHWCALKGHLESLSVLTYLRPSLLMVLDRSGSTPYELALSANNQESLDFLALQYPHLSDSAASVSASAKQKKLNNSCSNRLKHLLSKRTIERVHTVLPAYSYLASLVLCLFFSVYVFAQDALASTLTQLTNISLQMLVWWLSWQTYSTNPGALQPQYPTQCQDSGADCTTHAPHQLCAGRRSYMTALEKIRDSALGSSSFSSSRLFCCHLCRIHRPMRAGHGKLCRRCVPRYDHFCYFLWSDVGRDNYRPFFLFLAAMALLAMPLYMWLTAQYLRRLGHFETVRTTALGVVQDSAHSSTYPLLTAAVEHSMKFFLVWCILIWLMISALLAVHCRMTALGMTTREYIGGAAKFPYLAKKELYSLDSWAFNFADRLWPLSDDECFDESEMREFVVRSRVRLVTGCSAVNLRAVVAHQLSCTLSALRIGAASLMPRHSQDKDMV